jgi:hypothetical protein
MIVPPNAVYHQHFNTGKTPARYLAFKYAGSPRNSQGVLLCFMSRRIGGDQLDYADESGDVRQMFTDALARNGLSSRMEEHYRKELETCRRSREGQCPRPLRPSVWRVCPAGSGCYPVGHRRVPPGKACAKR